MTITRERKARRPGNFNVYDPQSTRIKSLTDYDAARVAAHNRQAARAVQAYLPAYFEYRNNVLCEALHG